MGKFNCNECEGYAKDGHNYCRVCGYHLTRGYSQNGPVAYAPMGHERFCGHCGGPKGNCKCTKPLPN